VPRRSLREATNRLTDGQLDALLKDCRGQHLTFREMARRVDARFHLDVTSETIRVWCHDLEGAAA
jgi:hypothetical protein